MAIVLIIASISLSLLVSAQADAKPVASALPDVLDVPYVPQGELLCGGAALAMVFRYWGDDEAVSEDFASNLDAEGRGILTDALVEAAESRGWSSFAWHAQPDEVRDHLSRGRPVITLIEGGARTLHYVVLVGWSSGQVIYHDPAVNPSRALSEEQFLARWNDSRGWALLVLPRETHLLSIRTIPEDDDASPDFGVMDSSNRSTDLWQGDIAQAVRLAQSGEVAQARKLLHTLHAEHPDAGEPLRELAGIAFLEGKWSEASELASEALERDPGDSLSYRILAGSRFLEGDAGAALASWNHLDEPRLDLAEIQGSNEIRYRVVADQLGIRHGEMITGPALRQAERRLREIPAVSSSRVSLVPASHGRARLEIAIVERPLLPRDSRSLLRIGARSAVRRELLASAASLTGNGELWTVQGRWSEERPLVALSLAIPNPRGGPGIWRIDSAWERQAFRREENAPMDVSRDSTSVDARPPLVREERRRNALSASDWILPDVRFSMGVALDRWNDNDRFLAVDDEVEIRLGGNHLAWTTWGSLWIALRSDAADFHAGRTLLEWESAGIERADSWSAHFGLHTVSARAPLSIWPNGPSLSTMGRVQGPLPLRAHPRVEDDIVTRELSPSIWSSGLEKRIFPWHLGFLRLGAAAFVDAIGPLGSHPGDGARWNVDAGVGILLREVGSTETIRLDLAHGIHDGAWALALSWQGKRRG